MSRRSVRASVIKKTRKLSKYETQLEDALRQKDIYTASVNDTSSLSVVPDMIIIPDQDNSSTVIVLPTTYFDEDKLVEVVNNDASEAVSVGGVSCTSGEKSTLRFNGSSYEKLFSIALV
jgi:hypothetical protein